MSELVQLSFDYSVLSPEQAQRTQEAEYRIIGRTQKTIVENGRDLLAVQEDIGRGHFLKWIQCLKISESTAFAWMSVAKNFGENSDNRSFDSRALYLLSTRNVPEAAREEARERASAGETITEEVAKQIRDAHKAREQAEKETELARQQLWQTQEVSRARSEQLNAEIDKLRLEMELLQKPATISPEALAQIDTLTKQRDNLSRLVDGLSADLDTLREANEVKRVQEMQELRIRQAWRETADAFRKQVLKLLAQFPSAIATESFEVEDWERLVQAQELALRFQTECARLSNRSAMSFVESG
jgi:hypothetical protein